MARESPATYRRRRLGALVALAAAVVFLILAFRDGGDGADEIPTTPGELRELALEREPVNLTISASGDLLIHSPVFARALELGGGDDYRFEPMLDDLRPYVEDPALALCHVETPMSAGIPPSGYPLFNAPPDLAEAVAAIGWDACDTASNHTLDQGADGIEGTLKALDRAGVEHTGSFSSRRERAEPLIVDVEGIRVALLAYTTDTNGLPLPEPHSVNVARRPSQVVAAARRARERGADAVIVNMHWGSEIVAEYSAEPSRQQERFANALAASDEITAVVGQGPHVVQPIEFVDGVPVVFSEGNLISNQGPAAGLAASSQDGLIALLDLVVDGGGARVERVRYVPVWVSQPDYAVLPVGDALERGEADEASLRDSYRRTVSVAGRGEGVEPIPPRLG